MAIYGEIGKVGLSEFSGTIQEEFLRELRGKDGYKRFNEMRLNSPVVGAMLLAIENSVRWLEWNFTSEEGENDPRLELLNASLDALTTGLADHIIEALTMLPFGWSIFEIVYQQVGSQVLWRKFAVRGQDTLQRWEYDPAGGLAGFVQVAAPNYQPVTIPIEKCILYRTRIEKNNPEGRSVLRTAWIPYYYQKNIAQVEAIGIERDLAGLPVIYLPPGADTGDGDNTDAGKARKFVRNIRNDEQAGLVLPNEWRFELVSTGGSRQFDTDAIIRRYESRILMSTLTQFLALGQNSVGTQALSTDQTDFFNMSINSVADIIADAITKYAIPRLCALNGVEANGLALVHTPAGDRSLTEIATFLQQVQSLITWTAQDETWLRSIAKLPEIDPEEIEMERERKMEQSLAIMQKAGNRNAQDNNQDESQDDEGQMGVYIKKYTSPSGGMFIGGDADWFAGGRAPDNAERQKWENRLYRLTRTWLKGQQERVIKSAKKVKRG